MWDTAAVSSFVTLHVGTSTDLAPRCCSAVLTPPPLSSFLELSFPSRTVTPAFVLRPEIVSSFYFGCLIRMQLDSFLMTNILYTDIKMCPILFFIPQQKFNPIVLGTLLHYILLHYIKSHFITLNTETLPCVTSLYGVMVTKKRVLKHFVSSHHPGSQTSQS